MERARNVAIVVAVAMVVAGAVDAQELDLGAMSRQMRKNQEELRSYSWQTKMNFLVNDQLRRSDIYTVRYVMGGMVEKMQISSQVAKGKVRGPDGKKLSKKDLEAAQQFVIDVKNQLDGYLNPLFAEKAVASAEVARGDGTVLLVSRDVMTTGDTVEITLSETAHTPISASVKTSVDGSPVTLDVTFGSLEYGPNYPARSMTIGQWQGMKVSIQTENSNYIQGGV